jgi:hypothetical protein
MKAYQFVGGPIEGRHADFLKRLETTGGVPPEWRIYPEVHGDGLALHVIEADSEAPDSHVRLHVGRTREVSDDRDSTGNK